MAIYTYGTILQNHIGAFDDFMFLFETLRSKDIEIRKPHIVRDETFIILKTLAENFVARTMRPCEMSSVFQTVLFFSSSDIIEAMIMSSTAGIHP